MNESSIDNVVRRISSGIKKIYSWIKRYQYVYFIFAFLMNIIITFPFLNFNILYLLLTIDGIYVALDFFLNNMNTRMTDSEIVAANSKLYKVGLVERYVFYCITSLSHIFLTKFVLCTGSLFPRLLSGLVANPIIFNKIINFYNYSINCY